VSACWYYPDGEFNNMKDMHVSCMMFIQKPHNNESPVK